MEPYNNRQQLQATFRKYLDGTATPEEKRFVEAWYESFEKKESATITYSERDIHLMEVRMERAIREQAEIEKPLPLWKELRRTLTPGRVAAAVVLACTLTGAWFYFVNVRPVPTIAEHTMGETDLPPGRDKGVLTLSDGRRIILDEASEGMLAREGNTLIHKLEDGLVSYSAESTRAANEYNTLTVPSGGKYSVVLPDGTRIWLNAESSVTFPTAFTADERSVKVSGEAYFEIAKDPSRPFLVAVGNQQRIRVLGTHFNVNAYRDEESITTTLLEGSVEIVTAEAKAKPVKLKPGQQATLTGRGAIRIRDGIDTDEITAWKNGLFQFEKADIEGVMRQFSRWYNVDIRYEGPKPEKKFSGKIDRHLNASEALEILRFTGVNFRIDSSPTSAQRGWITVLP